MFLSEQVERAIHGESVSALAREYGVSHQAIHNRIKRETGFSCTENRLENRIPAGPLVDYVERRAIEHSTVLDDEMEDVRRGIEALVPLEWAAEEWVTRLIYQFKNAKARGTISYNDADQIICRILGTHPYAVYGDAWWDIDFSSEEAEGVAA